MGKNIKENGEIIEEYVVFHDAFKYNDISEINAFIAFKNPFRYRSYYYDFETNLYYLNSRYYDPEIGRFINADDVSILTETMDELNGLNLYAYCFNNPVNDSDTTGNWSWKKFWKAIGKIFTAVTAIVLAVTTFGAGIPLLMGIVAGVTLVAGVLTAVDGIATLIEAGTNYNFIRDGIFQGNETAYNWFSGITEGVAAVGSMILGVYHSTGQFKAAKQGQKFLGKGYNKVGNKRWISKDGMRQLRWDYKGHGKYGPHFNLESWAFPIGSKGNYILPGGNNHLFYKLFKWWSVIK